MATENQKPGRRRRRESDCARDRPDFDRRDAFLEVNPGETGIESRTALAAEMVPRVHGRFQTPPAPREDVLGPLPDPGMAAPLDGPTVQGSESPPMTTLALVAALAAGPDSLPPPVPVARETVYVERVTPALNPQAAPPAPEKSPAWVKNAIGIAGIVGGSLLFVKGANERDTEVFVNEFGELDTRKEGWSGGMTAGVLVFAVGIFFLALK